MDWSRVDYLWIIIMFLSAVWTLILTAPIHFRQSIGEKVMECTFLQICYDLESHLHLGVIVILIKVYFLGVIFL